MPGLAGSHTWYVCIVSKFGYVSAIFRTMLEGIDPEPSTTVLATVTVDVTVFVNVLMMVGSIVRVEPDVEGVTPMKKTAENTDRPRSSRTKMATGLNSCHPKH